MAGEGRAAMDALRNFERMGGSVPQEIMQMDGGAEATNAQNAAEDAPVRKKIGAEQLRKANDALKKYKAGKARLEERLVADEKWWEGRAWDVMQNQGNPMLAKRPTMWLFNVIMGKHADMMEAYPEPVILPREESDQNEAKMLTSILPVVLEQNEFEHVYSKQAWEKNKHGTAAYAVYWDQSKHNGLGDVSICGVDLINLFWEPGIEDIQKSENVFYVSKQSREQLLSSYPQLEGKNLQSDFAIKKYENDDATDDTNKALVVDWYYHTYEGGKKTLQYCKYCGLEVLYSSEDDERLQGAGWYDDGEYPFVIDALFPKKGTIAGKGYIDLGKNAQESIDLMDQAVTLNTISGAIPRYLKNSDASINTQNFLDFTNPLIEVEGQLNENDLIPFTAKPLGAIYVSVLNNKIEELKQTCGNQDVNNGATGGVTAASGIAALQEAAGRSSRDANKGTYRAYSRILTMVIERIRQFYDVPRQFRILGNNAQMEFAQYSNAGIKMQPNEPIGGMDMGMRKPVFDIQVAAQKQNAYTKMAQNELALQLLQAGVYNPQTADQSLMLLSMMDFKGKDELMQKIQQNSMMLQQLAMWQQMAMELAERYEPGTAQQMANAVMTAQRAPTPSAGAVNVSSNAADAQTEDKRMRDARERAQSASQPQ